MGAPLDTRVCPFIKQTLAVPPTTFLHLSWNATTHPPPTRPPDLGIDPIGLNHSGNVTPLPGLARGGKFPEFFFFC